MRKGAMALAALAILGALAKSQQPEIQRYLRIRAM